MNEQHHESDAMVSDFGKNQIISMPFAQVTDEHAQTVNFVVFTFEFLSLPNNQRMPPPSRFVRRGVRHVIGGAVDESYLDEPTGLHEDL